MYSPRDPGTLRFSRPLSLQQYEASKVDHSHSALVELLDSIVRNQAMADREKRRRLKQVGEFICLWKDIVCNRCFSVFVF